MAGALARRHRCAGECGHARTPPPDTNTVTIAPQAYRDADGLFASDQYARAVVAYEAFAATSPQHEAAPSALFKAGLAHAALAQTNAAAKLYQRVVQEYPDSPITPNAHYALAEWHRAQGDETAALDAYRAVVAPALKRRNPLLPGALYWLGELNRRQMRKAEALDAYAQILVHCPDSELAPPAAFWMGELQFKLLRYEQAVLAFRSLVRDYPAHELADDALVKIVTLCERLGDYRQAKVANEVLLKSYPSSEFRKDALIRAKNLP